MHWIDASHVHNIAHRLEMVLSMTRDGHPVTMFATDLESARDLAGYIGDEEIRSRAYDLIASVEFAIVFA